MTNDSAAWRRGDRVHDDDYGLTGTVEEVGATLDDESLPVLYVRWGDGTQSDFVPDEKTHRIDASDRRCDVRDDELTAAWNACMDPAVDDWSGDEVAIMRCALDADTPEAMRRALRESGVGPSDVRNRLADELCRRFPLPITAAVLNECGFAFTGDLAGVGLFDLRGTDGRVDAYWDPNEGGVRVAWGESVTKCGREFVADARRFRELCDGLKLVYGKRGKGHVSDTHTITDAATVVGVCTVQHDGDPVDVTALRAALGGWGAALRAVLADERFEPIAQSAEYVAWLVGGTRVPLIVEWRPSGWTLNVAVPIPLRSPAHLRELVGHARELFGNNERSES